jgi:hypothetical protein
MILLGKCSSMGDSQCTHTAHVQRLGVKVALHVCNSAAGKQHILLVSRCGSMDKRQRIHSTPRMFSAWGSKLPYKHRGTTVAAAGKQHVLVSMCGSMPRYCQRPQHTAHVQGLFVCC